MADVWVSCVVGFGLTLLALGVCRGPIAQDVRYHQFADTRRCCGMPNALDVLSNVGFLAVGVVGWEAAADLPPEVARAWRVFFVGVGAVAGGSAYYHWAPSNPRLVWDRLPMTVGFMSLFVLVLHDCAALPIKLLDAALGVAVAVGALSVAYWHVSGDLRPYIAVQYYPLLCIAVLLVAHADRTQATRYGGMLGWYAAAKWAEARDRCIFTWTRRIVSGHTLKHLLATVATGWAALSLARAPLFGLE